MYNIHRKTETDSQRHRDTPAIGGNTMNISTHRVTDLIISTPETRRNTPASESYEVVSVIAIDVKGNEVELTIFSRDGKLNIIHTNDKHKAVQAVHNRQRKERLT